MHAVALSVMLALQTAHAQDLVQSPDQASMATHGIAKEGDVSTRENVNALQRHFTFSTMRSGTALRLRPSEGAAHFTFAQRIHERVVKAMVRVRYTHSPALIPIQSHVKLLLNGEVVAVLPAATTHSGKDAIQTIALKPGLIKKYNRMSFEFIGHYASECEDPLHPAIWLDLLQGTEVVLETEPVPVPADLALLPQPFFDDGDLHELNLPFVLPTGSSRTTLQAAGITASWFGVLADFRQSRFPVMIDALPTGHAIVLATNTERPAFLKGRKPFSGPALSIIAHPAQPRARLLLISGRDGFDLQTAAIALATGTAALSGQHIDIRQVRQLAPREPYDAPRWVRTDRPILLADLVRSKDLLQTLGHEPEPVQIELRMPPDLFTWQSEGVPVNLKYRYSTPWRADQSSLQMYLNGDLVRSVRLAPGGAGLDGSRIIVPLVNNNPATENEQPVRLPAFRVGYPNDLKYAFTFTHPERERCPGRQVSTVRAQIDPRSMLDFSGHHHYATMPNIGYFATMGFPFTKYADLGGTAFVLPPKPSARDIEIMLSVLARMGASTGYPATRYILTDPSDTASLRDRDLVLIGAAGRQRLLDIWSDRLPALLTGPHKTIRTGAAFFETVGAWLPGGGAARPDEDGRHLKGYGPLGALLSFESPVTPQRTVVAITGVKTDDMRIALDMMEDKTKAQRLYGSVVLIHDGAAESYYAGPVYTIGSLPWLTAIWYQLSKHPAALAVAALFTVLVIALGLRRVLSAIAAKRLR